MARVVTSNGNDKFLHKDPTDFTMKGICIDLWERTSRELNISYTMEVAEDWEKMTTVFVNNQADIIVERMDQRQMALRTNMTD